MVTLVLDFNLLTLIFIFCRSHHHGGDPEDGSQGPDTDVDNFGLVGRADVQGLDGVADGNIAVHTHHCECEGAGKHVVIVNGDGDLAEGIPKWPGAQDSIRALERQGHKAQGISQGKVEDVDVCSCLHLGESIRKERQEGGAEMQHGGKFRTSELSVSTTLL